MKCSIVKNKNTNYLRLEIRNSYKRQANKSTIDRGG